MIDNLIVIFYLIATLVIGLYASKGNKSLADYAVAGRKYTTPILLVSVTASLIGGGSTVGFAAKIYKVGIIAFLISLGEVIHMLIVAKFLVPKLKKFNGMISLGDVMNELYGRPGKIISGVMGLIFCFGAAGAQLLAIGIIFHLVLNVPLFIGVLIGSVPVIIYSSIGGIKAVTITDIFQFAIMVIVIPIICSLLINKLGGISNIINNIPPSHFNIFEIDDVLLYISIFAWYCFPDLHPIIVQSCLMGKDRMQVSKAFYITALLELAFKILILGIAFSALIIFPSIEPNHIFPKIINEILPYGIKGLAIVGMLAIIMSTADSCLNVGSIIFVNDVLGGINKKITEKQKLKLIKMATVLLGIAAIFVAVYSKNVLDTVIYFAGPYIPIVSVPILVGVLGVKVNHRSYIIAVIISLFVSVLISFFVWDKYLPLCMIPASVASLLSILLVSYLGNRKRFNFFRINYIPRIKIRNILSLQDLNFGFISFKKMNEFSSSRVKLNGAEYYLFATFGCINYLIPYFMFPYSDAQYYPVVLAVRIIVGVMCVVLLLKDYWPISLQPYIPLYWHITLLVYLPLNTTFLFLLEKASTGWLLNMALSIFMLAALVDWLSFVLILPTGTFLGYLLYKLIVQDHAVYLLSDSILLIIYMCLFSSIVGLLFTRKKNISEKEQLDSFKVLGGAIAHELRSPLSLIQLNANKINVQSKQDQEFKTAIIQSVRRSNKLINSILMNLKSYMSDRTETKVTISACIKEALISYPFVKGEEKLVEIDIRNDFEFKGNKVYIAQIINNLLKNSLYYTKLIDQPKIKITTNYINDEKILVFSDNGTGIDSKTMKNIFKSFYSEREFGTGIGLTFCKMVMEALGGTIKCVSEKSKYTEFVLKFP